MIKGHSIQVFDERNIPKSHLKHNNNIKKLTTGGLGTLVNSLMKTLSQETTTTSLQ